MKDDGVTRAQDKQSEDWRGLTIFYEDLPSYQETCVVYFDTPEGLAPIRTKKDQVQDIEDIFQTWNGESRGQGDPWEVYQLRMKSSGKELDLAFFGPAERAAYGVSDAAEWLQWVKNKCTRLVP